MLHEPLLPGVTTAGVRTPRRPLDQYFTPPAAVDALLAVTGRHLGGVLEPCVGSGVIERVLRERYEGIQVITNDIDVRFEADYHLDMTRPESWDVVDSHSLLEWVITNPPYDAADTLVPLAVDRCYHTAMLLPITWLEPTRKRRAFLASTPPTHLIVLPRLSFTDDGRKDRVTSVWAIWSTAVPRGVTVVPAL